MFVVLASMAENGLVIFPIMVVMIANSQFKSFFNRCKIIFHSFLNNYCAILVLFCFSFRLLNRLLPNEWLPPSVLIDLGVSHLLL